MKKYLVILILFLTITNSYSQKVYNHGVFWLRLSLADRISSKLQWELYLQKRTQNAAPGEANVFAAPHFTSAWFWLNYSATKNLKLSISPFGYFDSHVFNTTVDDMDIPGRKEFRGVVRVETKQVFSFFNYFNRYSLEYRWRDMKDNGEYKPSWRIRYMARLEKPVKGILSREKPVTFYATNEVFIQFGKTVKSNANIFDQNRFNIGFNYEVVKNVKVSLSYLNIIQTRVSSKDAIDNAHALWVIIAFDNVFSQFSKKKTL